MSEVRIDKYLWAMRLYKTRTVATDACKKGRVTVGGVAVKPSRPVKVGEVIDVRRPPVTYSFRVLALAQNRLGARLVPGYMENVTPKSQLDLLDVVKISGFVDRRKGLGRPTKREGRDLKEFTDAFTYDDDGWDDFGGEDPEEYEENEEYEEYEGGGEEEEYEEYDEDEI